LGTPRHAQPYYKYHGITERRMTGNIRSVPFCVYPDSGLTDIVGIVTVGHRFHSQHVVGEVRVRVSWWLGAQVNAMQGPSSDEYM
jgi:hypothetical protein